MIKIVKGKVAPKSGASSWKVPKGARRFPISKNSVKGVPKARVPDNQVVLDKQDSPDTEGKPHLEKEKVKSQVEILLLKGVISISQISITLGIKYLTASRYIEEVHYRWAALGSPERVQQVRGEARARLEILTNELWVLFSNSKIPQIKVQCLNQLGAVYDRFATLNGITPKMVQVLVNMEARGDIGTIPVESRISSHSSLVRLATELSRYANPDSEDVAVEGEYEEVKRGV